MTEAEVRKVAIALWNSLKFGSGTQTGLSVDMEAYKAAIEATHEVGNPEDSRRDPAGRPMDLLAPSVWHALCLLMFLFVRTRIKDTTFDDPENIDTLFGTQVLYRGQARCWNIVPSAWRSAAETVDNEKRLAALSAFWKEWSSPEHDVSFDLFGRIADADSTAAVAQHYGMPTTLVDFTFDPRIAVWFANSETGSDATPDIPANLREHAVVYFSSFHKLASVGKCRIRLPHPAALRIYRQSGCFVDFGPKPKAVPAILDFEEPWMWVQENCFRLFFPRKYPTDLSLEEISHEWIYAADDFFEESVGVAKKLDSSMLREAELAVNALMLGAQRKPSWKTKDESSTNFIYVDEDFWRLVGPVETYLRVAGLIETRVGPKLDPFILAGLAMTNFDAPNALQTVAKLPYEHSPGIVWMAERIAESKRLLGGYLGRHPQPAK